jgi:peptidoglycan/xylan/chitin deacetylase (PgdA/CDA1 family)
MMPLPKTLRSHIVRMGSGAAYYSGALKLSKRLGHRVGVSESCPFVILLYHRVNSAANPFFPAVSVKVFDAQMKYLARSYKVLGLGEIIDRINRGQGVPPDAIAVTFDDGYRDNYLFAHPILRKYNLSATVFVATKFISEPDLMWNDRLASSVQSTSEKQLVYSSNGKDLTLKLETKEQKLQALEILLEHLKTCAEDEKEKTLETLVAALGDRSPAPEKLMLNWSELRAMAAEGWNIGSHTVNHPILTRVDLSRVEEELINSRKAIERELQQSVRLCAYPNGKRSDYSQEIKAIAKRSGYSAAATTLRGINRSGVDLFELRRWSVWEDHLPTLACKLRYSYRREMPDEDEV